MRIENNYGRDCDRGAPIIHPSAIIVEFRVFYMSLVILIQIQIQNQMEKAKYRNQSMQPMNAQFSSCSAIVAISTLGGSWSVHLQYALFIL